MMVGGQGEGPPSEECLNFIVESQQFLTGSATLVRSLRHIHRGLVSENKRYSALEKKTLKNCILFTACNFFQNHALFPFPIIYLLIVKH